MNKNEKIKTAWETLETTNDYDRFCAALNTLEHEDGFSTSTLEEIAAKNDLNLDFIGATENGFFYDRGCCLIYRDSETDQWVSAETKNRELVEYIKNAENLEQLRDALNNLGDEIDYQYSKGVVWTQPKIDNYVDTSELPVFGPDFSNPEGVYSWDNKNYLVEGNGHDEHFKIIPAADF